MGFRELGRCARRDAVIGNLGNKFSSSASFAAMELWAGHPTVRNTWLCCPTHEFVGRQ